MTIALYGLGLLFAIKLFQGPYWYASIGLLVSGIGFLIWKYAYIK